MKRHVLLLLLMQVLPSMAAEPEAEGKSIVIREWMEQQAKVSSWKARFTQLRSIQTLAQPIQTPGKVWFEKPDRFRWELGDPAGTVAMRQGSDFWILYPKLKTAEHYPMDQLQERRWRPLLALLQIGFPTSQTEFEKQFKVLDIQEGDNEFTLKLVPRGTQEASWMKEMVLVLARDDFLLLRTEMYFADGSSMVNKFEESERNMPIDDELFEPALDGFRVIEPLSTGRN